MRTGEPPQLPSDRSDGLPTDSPASPSAPSGEGFREMGCHFITATAAPVTMWLPQSSRSLNRIAAARALMAL
jgi:hypothetical protein